MSKNAAEQIESVRQKLRGRPNEDDLLVRAVLCVAQAILESGGNSSATSSLDEPENTENA